MTEHRTALATSWGMHRRPPGYLAHFGRGAGPEQLPAGKVHLLAQFSQVNPRLFCAREDWEPCNAGFAVCLIDDTGMPIAV